MNGRFYLHTSNRLEDLAAELARVVSVPLASPFTPEVIMVQSQGMRRWVSLQLAERLGVCMNADFPFPRKFLGETLRAVVPESADSEAFSVEAMTWAIHRILPVLIPLPEFTPVRRYVADGDPVKLYQLAARLAHLFDQYLAYRPAMLLGWERALPPAEMREERWQALLWRELNPAGAFHFGAVLETMAERASKLPAGERISIFGISSLPPAQMEFFFHLAASRPVHLFLLSPSSEYHGDDLTPKQRARKRLPAGSGSGNALLTSLGRLNAQFIEVLLEANERAGHRMVDEFERFSEPAGNTLLERIQRDILRARQPGDPDADLDFEPETLVSSKDDSLSIHLCHSPMREVEVLYDQLLALMAADPALQPRDILVMAPDIERYAPFIHAVFGYPEEASLKIPYSVADRHPRSESRVTDTFLRLLDLPGARCTAPEVYALLESEPFRLKFRFSDDDLALIRHWIHESGIRWGLDGEHRAAMGVPAMEEATWRHGLDRILLGYAMPGGNRTLFEGMLPYDDIEGSSAELAGRLVAAIEAITGMLEWLKPVRSLGEWPPILEQVIERFFACENAAEETDAVRQLREAFGPEGQLARIAVLAGADQLVPFEALREHLSGVLGEAEQRGRFLMGGVTFCALKPMRSIPVKVIWLLGMNEGAFPRRPKALQFDLMAKHRKLGDRSVRDDDRYLFLETLISARERLGISAVGRSVSDNEPIPPSIVVSELLDYLEKTPFFAPGEMRKQVVTEHRLQAFNAKYFQPGGPFFSYSQANANAAVAVATQRSGVAQAAPFAPMALPEPGPGERHTTLDRLESFLKSPADFFLRQRLGFDLRESDDSLGESEPLLVDSLSAYSIRKELFDGRLRGLLPADAATFSSRALTPPGALGDQHRERLDREAAAFHSRIAPLIGPRDEPVSGSLVIGSFVLDGALEALYGGRLILFRPASLTVKDRLRAWLQHLFRCALLGPATTVLAGDGEIVEYRPPEQPAAEILASLLDLYWEGLSRPLPFFAEAAYLYADAKLFPSARRKKTPLEVAATAYFYGQYGAECDKPVHQLCFAHEDPIGQEFEALAAVVWEPLLTAQHAYQEEGR